MATKFLNLSDNSRIAYIECGLDARYEGQSSIIYLGGFCSSMRGTKATMIAKWAGEEGLPFVLFDYRGNGESSGKFLDFGIDHWIDDAIAVIDQVVAGPVILVGSSMGGWIGAAVAKRRASLVKAFIGIASAPDFTEIHFRPKLSPADLEKLSEDGVTYLPSGYPDPYPIGQALMEGGERSQVFKKDLMMPFPVRLFQGMKDRSVSTEVAVRFAEHIQSDDLELTLVKDADHGFSRDKDMAQIYRAIKLFC